MAQVDFFSNFQLQWGETGATEPIQDTQYRQGWAYIGSAPPSVEQFNKVQQLNDQKSAWLFRQFSALANLTGHALAADADDALSHALSNLDAGRITTGTLPVARGGTGRTSASYQNFLIGGGGSTLLEATPSQALAIMGGVPVVSIATLPATNQGPVIVAEVAEVWVWVQTAYFTGYRSPLCGRPVDGHTINPLASEVDAVGGLLSKTAYAGLWGYARENNLVVTQSTWSANIGAHWFVDVNSTQFRVPDLRNMFRRFTGTDADTANARAMASRQMDANRAHAHDMRADAGRGALDAEGPDTIGFGGGGYSGQTQPAGGAEARPVNVAYHPRLHA
ncbi:Prophage tail fiber protein [plant metagenome]|uniref:Prophage tail fiber protein n=1 Tax=plant metagenome TaxID=1297885 RepID=A0A484U2K7_9ZZZZ